MRARLENIFQRYVVIRDRALPPLVALLIGTFLIFACDRRIPLEVGQLTITPVPVRPGAPAYVIYEASVKRMCDGKVHRTIIDSGSHIFTLAPEPSIYADLLEGGARKQFVKTFIVPVGIAPGVAKYIADVDRWCNWPQRLIWKFHDHYEAVLVIAK